MRKTLLAAAIFTAATLGSMARPAHTQSLDAVTLGVMQSGDMKRPRQRITSDDPGYDAIYGCVVPSGSLGIVTVAKTTSGPMAVIVEAAKSFATDGHGHVITTDVIDRANLGSKPAVLWTGATSEEHTLWFAIEFKDTNAGKFHVYCDHVDLGKQLAFAALRTAITYAVSGTSLETSNNTARGINLMLSILAHGNNVMAIGLDAAREEMVIKLNQQFPNSPLLVNFLSDVFTNVAGGIYEHAFYEMSHPFADD